MFNFGEQELSEYLEEMNKAKNQRQESRDYKCPKCDGEFNRWDTHTGPTGRMKKVCPFCRTVRGSYLDEEAEEAEEPEEDFDFDEDMSDEEIGERLIEAFFGISMNDFDENQTNLQDLLEQEYRSPEQDRGGG